MLALAIISTVILGIFIVLCFYKYTDDENIELIIGNAFVIVLLMFIIITIWILYAR